MEQINKTFNIINYLFDGTKAFAYIHKNKNQNFIENKFFFKIMIINWRWMLKKKNKMDIMRKFIFEIFRSTGAMPRAAIKLRMDYIEMWLHVKKKIYIYNMYPRVNHRRFRPRHIRVYSSVLHHATRTHV